MTIYKKLLWVFLGIASTGCFAISEKGALDSARVQLRAICFEGNFDCSTFDTIEVIGIDDRGYWRVHVESDTMIEGEVVVMRVSVPTRMKQYISSGFNVTHDRIPRCAESKKEGRVPSWSSWCHANNLQVID